MVELIGLAGGGVGAASEGRGETTREEHLQSPLLLLLLLLWFWWAVVVIALLWLLGPQVVRLWLWMAGVPGEGGSGASAGAFGGPFGAINALFSGLAFRGGWRGCGSRGGSSGIS